MPTPIPNKVLSRKDEITADFLKLVDVYFDDLLAGRVDRRFHTKDFASQLFIHPVHLTNTVQLVSGKSPCDHLEERILLESQKLLRETDLSVAEVGYRFNFMDPTNFTKFFKNIAGVTPLKYRKGLVAEVV